MCVFMKVLFHLLEKEGLRFWVYGSKSSPLGVIKIAIAKRGECVVHKLFTVSKVLVNEP